MENIWALVMTVAGDGNVWALYGNESCCWRKCPFWSL